MWSLTRGVEPWKNHNILFMAVHCGASLKVKTISSSAYTTLGVDWMAYLDRTVREADVGAQLLHMYPKRRPTTAPSLYTSHIAGWQEMLAEHRQLIVEVQEITEETALLPQRADAI